MIKYYHENVNSCTFLYSGIGQSSTPTEHFFQITCNYSSNIFMYSIAKIHFTQSPAQMLPQELEMEGKPRMITFSPRAFGTPVIRVSMSDHTHSCLCSSWLWSLFAFKTFDRMNKRNIFVPSLMASIWPIQGLCLLRLINVLPEKGSIHIHI